MVKLVQHAFYEIIFSISFILFIFLTQKVGTNVGCNPFMRHKISDKDPHVTCRQVLESRCV